MKLSMHGFFHLVAASALSLSLGASGYAQQPATTSIIVEKPWIRMPPGGAKVAGGYLTIKNSGTTADRLLGGTLPQAGRFEIHEMKMEGQVMRMRPVAGGVEIGPGQQVELKPGGFHIMLMDLRQPLKQGEKVKGQLRFEKAGTIEIEYAVEGIGGQTQPKQNH
jgi:copper(I)-binding protein